MGFSKRLKLLRKNADVTQDELAQYLQVSRSTIAGYETKNRQPDYDKLYMIAQFFMSVPIISFPAATSARWKCQPSIHL